MKPKHRVLTGLFRLSLLTGLLAFGLVASLHNANSQGGFRFDRQGFACVMENVQTYISTATDPVVIFIKFCPQTGVTPDMLRSIQRNASPDLPSIRDGKDPPAPNAVAVEPVISFTKEELACLAEKWRSGHFSDGTVGNDTVVVGGVCGL